MNDGRAEEHAVAAIGHAAVARDEAAKVLQKKSSVMVSFQYFSVYFNCLNLLYRNCAVELENAKIYRPKTMRLAKNITLLIDTPHNIISLKNKI